MEIDSLITRAVLTVDADETVRDAAVWMVERGVGSAVVMTDGRPVGIITDRDSIRLIARGEDPDTVTAGKCILKNLKTVSPSLEVLDAARMMREQGFRHLVVVDDDGKLAGVFSMRDLVVGLLQERTAAAS
ncbi:MAG: CBS domain-containing protein [Acidimicrobiales bacterium]